jgi:acetoin utilization deacetylase AcuC-like enzyme
MTRRRKRPESATAADPDVKRIGHELEQGLRQLQEDERQHPLTLFYAPDYWAEAPDFDTFRKSYWIERSLTTAPGGQRSHVRWEEPDWLGGIDLTTVHTEAYVDAVRTGEPPAMATSNGFDWTPGVYGAAYASTQGAALAALRALSTGRPTGSLSAGLHHARADRGAAFCTFNGLALAAHAAREAGAGAVLILDVDAHCGGGTFSIVSGWTGVWHADVSVSDVDAYDAAAHPRALTEMVTDGRSYLDTVQRVLDRLSSTAFDLLIYNAGMDPFERCDVGGLAGVSKEVLDRREQAVFDWARARTLPVAFVLAGGYTGARVSRQDLVGLHLLTIDAANPERPALVAPGRAGDECPLGDQWRTWDFLNLPRRVLPAKAGHFAERSNVWPEVAVADIVWERGAHDALYRPPTVEEGGGVSWRFEHGSPWHLHAQLEVDRRRVHLDRVGGTKYGPGRSWTEIVAFVDGACVAHGWHGGCSLGFGGTKHWPLTVAVSPTTNLVVTGEGRVTIHRKP